MRRKKDGYFTREKEHPQPIVVRVKRRISFSEVDPMAIAWHGRYPSYFEEAYAELGRQVGLSYRDFFSAGLRAPIVQIHVDYFQSLVLEENVTIEAALCWHEGARMNIEYRILKENGELAATGYTVQMFVDGTTQETWMTIPELLETCRSRWIAGEFKCLA